MSKIKIRILVLLFIGFSFAGCNLINPAEPIPAYIYIDKIELKTDASTEGSNSQKITDAWVYIDQEPVGVYELPAKFPVLFSGEHQVLIVPGITINGINATHGFFPFYKSISKQINLESGKITELKNDTVTYFPGTVFSFNPAEDFENGTSFVAGSQTDTTMVVEQNPDIVFEGTGCGKVHLDSGMQIFTVQSKDFTLPASDPDVYLEMNYKTTLAFTVGIIAEDAGGTKITTGVITLNKNSAWNKIYIDIGSTSAATPNAVKYYIFFTAVRQNVPESDIVLFDNIKVVHF